MDNVILYGLIVGLVFGIILQRGRLCFNSAIRDAKYFSDNFLLKAALLAIGLNALIFTGLAQFGFLKMVPLRFSPLGNIIGGFIFGIGMVLAGGCASGVTYRVGEGMTTAWFAAIFYGLFAASTKHGFLKPLASLLRGPTYATHGDGIYYADQKIGPTIATYLKINPWIPAIVFAVIIFIYLFKTKTSNRPGSPWNWYTIGILAAAISGIAYALRQYVEYEPKYGLGITGGWVALLKNLTVGSYLGWSGALILGIIIGSFLSAWKNKEFKLRMPKKPKTYVQVIGGGMLMGFGAALAGGCNIGHILTGLPHLALGSIFAAVAIVLGNWFGYYMLYARNG